MARRGKGTASPFHKQERQVRQGVADRVATDLLRLIASGEFKAGERLPGERQLADKMNVSRVSVRAALQRLKAQGFVTAVQGGGTRVVSGAGGADPALAELVRLDRGSLQELAEMRLILEVWAARRAAVHATAEQIREIRRILDEMERVDHQDATKAQLDVAFHMAVANASGSVVYRHLLSLIRATLTEMLTYHRYELFGTNWDDLEVLRQHRAIADAVAARDPEGAASAMERHLGWVLQRYRQACGTPPPRP